MVDFGLIAPGHQAVERAGTHGYWRPDGPTDRDSDLYAITKVAYRMLTGVEVSRFPEVPSDVAGIASPEQYRALCYPHVLEYVLPTSDRLSPSTTIPG